MLKGLLIGIGMTLPGVSGGVIAVILGIYDKIIYSLSNFFHDYKKNLKFLLPIIIGICIGAVIAAKILSFVFDKYYVESCYLFIGLIIGSVPCLIKESMEKDKKEINYFVTILAFVISIVISILCKNNVDFSMDLNANFNSFIKLFFTGLLFISGKIVPGLSSSFLLMMIGMYSYYINIVSNPISFIMNDFSSMIPILLGILVGAVIFIKLMNYLLKRYYSITYSIIIGFVLGSLVVIYPNTINIAGIIILIIGIYVSYWFSRIKK